MKRSTSALLIAILLHIIFVLLFIILNQVTPKPEKQPKDKEKRMKISLQERPKVTKSAAVKNKVKVKKSEIAPPMPKGKQLKKLIEPEKLIQHKPKPFETPQQKIPTPKKVTKTAPETKKTAPIPPIKPLISIEKKIEKPIKKSVEHNITKAKEPVKVIKEEPDIKTAVPTESSQLFAMLSKPQKQPHAVAQKQKSHKRSSQLSENFRDAYGDDFGKLSEGEQKYILDNEEIMRRITQQILNRVGRVNIPDNMRVNTSNIVEFYLHPNGDISDIKMVKKSGFYILDDTTKETIEYAYSRYPRPKQKTLIRYKVGYYLRGY